MSIEYNAASGLGKWYIWVQDPPKSRYPGASRAIKSYLWPDLTIRDEVFYNPQAHGYFESRVAAAQAINQFVRNGGNSGMCNLASLPSHVVQGVYDVLNAWHPQGKSFTAHDITTELRKRYGPKTPVLHGHVRDVVHELFRQGTEPFVKGYEATLATHLNPANPPLLYHPAGNVNPAAIQTSPPPAPTVSAPPLANHVPWRAEGRCAGIVRA